MTDDYHLVTVEIAVASIGWDVCGIVDAFARSLVGSADDLDVKLLTRCGDVLVRGSDLERVRNDLGGDPDTVTLRYSMPGRRIEFESGYRNHKVSVSGRSAELVKKDAETLRSRLRPYLYAEPIPELGADDEAGPRHPHIEERTLTVTNVIITPEDIRALLRVMTESVAQSREPLQIMCEAVEVKGANHQGGADIFMGNEVLERRALSSVILRGFDYGSDTSMSVRLEHGTTGDPELRFASGSGRITIRSSDQRWLNATIQAFETVIEEMEPQRTFADWQRHAIFIGILAAGLFLGASVIFDLVRAGISTTKTQGTTSQHFAAWSAISGYVVAMLTVFGSLSMASGVRKRIYRLYPKVELQLGRPHTRREEKDRKRAGWLATAVVLPIVIAVALSLVGGLLIH